METLPIQVFYQGLWTFCEGFVELRAFRGDQRRQKFFGIEDFEAINRWMKLHRDWNCFHAVGARKDNTSGALENVLHVPAVWCDIDFKTAGKRTAWSKIKGFIFEPSALIASGGGCHCYWFLKEPASPEEFPQLVDVLHRLADHFGGDHAACEAARVLRTPGSLNHKYDPPRECKVIDLKKFRYELTDLQDVLPESTYQIRKTNGLSANPEGWLLDAFRGVPESGNGDFPGRDATAVKIAGYFVDRMTDADLLTLLACWNVRNNPPLADADLQRIIGSVSRYRKTESNGTPNRAQVHFG